MLRTASKREQVGKRVEWLADITSAKLWLAEGAPIADVLTMLEVRHRFEFSSADCRAYATQILWTSRQQIHAMKPNLKPHRKEPHHAAA